MIDFKKLYSEYPLIDTIQSYKINLNKIGGGYEIEECPFCGGHNCFRTFANDTKWSCFQCPDNKVGKDVVDFIAYIEDITLTEAFAKILGNSAVEEYDEELKDIQLVKRLALDYYKSTLAKNLDKSFKVKFPDGEIKKITLREYYTEIRGVSSDFLLELGVGFSDGLLFEFLTSNEVPEKLIVRAGLYSVEGERDFIPKGTTVFCHFVDNNISHFSSDKGLLRDKNPLKSKVIYKEKQCVFYLQDTILPETNVIYLTEGCWDGLSLLSISTTVNGSASVMSTDGLISSEQIRFLSNLGLPIVQFFDNDRGGKIFRNKLLAAPDLKAVYDIPPEAFNPYKDINELIANEPDKVSAVLKLLGKATTDLKLYEIEKEKEEKDLLKINDEDLYNVELEAAVLHTVFETQNFDFLQQISLNYFYSKAHKTIVGILLSEIGLDKTLDLEVFRLKHNLKRETIELIQEAELIDVSEATLLLKWYAEKRVVNDTVTKLQNLISKRGTFENFRKSYLEIFYNSIESTYSELGEDTYTPDTLVEKADSSIPDDGYIKRISGFKNLDDLLQFGFYSGNVVLLAGRPSAGKSTVKINFLRNQCEEGYGVLSYTPENGVELELLRLDALMLNETTENLMLAKKSDELYERRVKNWHYIAENWAFIQSGESVSINKIISDLTYYRSKFSEVEHWIVYIDVASYMDELSTSTNLWFEIGKMVRRIRQISKPKYLNFCPVFIVHIGRDKKPNSRNSKNKHTPQVEEPSVHDLKGSSDWEGVSDLILLTHREKVYEEASVGAEDLMDIIIAKQRGGVSNVRTLFTFFGEYSKILPAEEVEESVGEDVEYTDFELPPE